MIIITIKIRSLLSIMIIITIMLVAIQLIVIITNMHNNHDVFY